MSATSSSVAVRRSSSTMSMSLRVVAYWRMFAQPLVTVEDVEGSAAAIDAAGIVSIQLQHPRRPCCRPQIAAEARNAAKHAGRQGHCPPETRAADADRAPAGRARRARRRRGSDPGNSVGSEPGAVDTFTRPHMTPVTHVVYAVHYSVHELETSSVPELSRCPWLPTHNLAYVAFEVLPGHAHSGWQRCETWEIAGA
jgi:hypothetical protein